MLPVQKNITPYNRNVRDSRTIQGIVIHAVGAVSSAKNNAVYYASKKLSASAHYFVDTAEIWQSVEDKDVAWHCGTANCYTQKHPTLRNANTIGIEMCQDTTTTVAAQTVANAAELVQYLMKKYGIPENMVVRHWDVVNKKCPSMYIDDAKWAELKAVLVGKKTETVPQTAGTGAASYKYKVGDRVIVSTNYVGPNDPIDKHMSVNPHLEMTILDIVVGARNPYHTNHNTYINDGDIRGYAPAVSVQPTVSAPNTTGSSIIKAGQHHCNNFVGVGLVIDGVRGSKTKTGGIACVQQACNRDYKSGIAVDGKWGPKSEAALGKNCVKMGETQYLVTAVEILLTLKGYDPKGVECPGKFGPDLESCVKQYQKDNGLTVDGIAGPATIKALMS